MSSISQSLTSNIDELYNILKAYNKQHKELNPDVVELELPPSEHNQSVSGRYKYSVCDAAGTVYDSGDWKPNLILNCGLDKIAEMPFSHVFQFAVAGTDPTPTKEVHEDTLLTVQLLSSDRCPISKTFGTACHPYKSPGGLVARATNSIREAPDASPLGTCVQRTFGESSDSNKLLYLRDIDMQYNVLTSCPVYAYEPIQPIIRLYGGPDGKVGNFERNTSSVRDILSGGWEIVQPGQGYIAALSADTGLPWNMPGGLITTLSGVDIPEGDCTVPLLCTYDSSHPLSGVGQYINPGAGVTVPVGPIRTPSFTITSKGCSLAGGKINIMDPGEALGEGTIPVQFDIPALGFGSPCPNLVAGTGSTAISAAEGIGHLEFGRLKSIEIPSTLSGWGYQPGEVVSGNAVGVLAGTPAKIKLLTDTNTGSITGVEVLDGGYGYSNIMPTEVCVPQIPEPDIVSYDLLLSPVETYESINNGHYHETNLDLSKGPSPSYKADIFNVNQTYLFNQYKTHGWYLTGAHPETNATYCGTDFLSAANQIGLTRTFDFYMELQPVTYTEIGFKESPASRELFSRISLDDPIRLCAGQFLRLTYQLLITYEPGPVPRYKEVLTEGGWYNGVNSNGQKVLSGYECNQGNGMCVIGPDGVANPYDITGLANEPFAPGTVNLGPQYGYLNRWKNGDTRLSWPTKEYKNDAENPWIHGGDQVNPPDWAIKYWDSPTVNYMPRDFRTYVEWQSGKALIPDMGNENATIKFKEIDIPSGPELPLERDAFDHWFTKAPPTLAESVTFTNFTPNLGQGKGRWDFLVTKSYLVDVYPNLLGRSTVYQTVRDDKWIANYHIGERVHIGGPGAYSHPGVFPGPVIEYTGSPGSLHDPLSFKGGRITRNVSAIRHPYTNNYITFLEPVNNGLGEYGPATIVYPLGCNRGSLTLTHPGFCYKNLEPLSKNRVDQDYAWLVERQKYYNFGSIDTSTVYPVDGKAGGGVFTKLDSWSPWSHTPLISSYELAYLTGPERKKLRPDTAGNWSNAEAIPVAGSSAWLSTSDEPFATYGQWKNRSHTLYGAVCGKNHRIENDYTRPLSFETPCYFIGEYTPGSGVRIKRATFETSMANLTGIKCVGIGPTSTTLVPQFMTDAPRFNTYMFKFGEVDKNDNPPAYEGFNNLSTYKLVIDFKYTWYRNLKI